MVQAIATIAGAIIGGAANYAATSAATKAKIKALEQVRDIQALNAREFTGQNEYNKLKSARRDDAARQNKFSLDSSTGNAFATDNKFDNIGAVGNYDGSQGQNRQSLLDSAKSGAISDINQNKLKQAGIDYNVKNAEQLSRMNALGTTAKTAGSIGNPFSSQTKGDKYNSNNNVISMQDNPYANEELIASDERVKESITTESGDKLPIASVEDALRQIASIVYKYKPETGLDDDKHVGISAQSIENTALDNGTVKTTDDGIKMLDKQKLQESIMAGIAALQKEIDGLKKPVRATIPGTEVE